MLRALWEHDGAPKLDALVPRLNSVRPRTVTATRQEIDQLIEAAPQTLRLFILLCSDQAIRSGTAVRIGPEHYNPRARELRFRTKYDEKVCLPVTEELAAILDTCDLTSSLPFITQLRRKEQPRAAARATHPTVDPHRLRKELRALERELGFAKRIVPHDLRRTTAVALYRRTQDLRKVQALLGHHNLQSTFWYLDHDLEPLDVADLEAIKRPYIVTRKERTA